MSVNGTFALEHRSGGELALRDRTHAGDLWSVRGLEVEPDPHSWGGVAGQAYTSAVPVGLLVGSEESDERLARNGSGRLVLVPDGYLVLEDENGRPRWRSGGVDRRVSAAVVTDGGRLVLVDPDGFQRWSRDPVTDADVAGYQPASGDRLTRGQRLAGPLTSLNGKYHLSHTPAGETTLVRARGGTVWRCTGAAGAELTLGHDGVLRTGTDSTVLAKWTGRRLDPVAYTVAALVVGDDGDVVLFADDGSEVYRSGTAAEEARLDRLEQQYARRERKNRAKPSRPRASGLPADWFRLLDIDEHYSITLAQGISAGEALLRLGVDAARIAPVRYADLAMMQDLSDDLPKRVFTAQIDDWVMLVELDATDGADRLAPMSRGTQAVVCARNYDGEEFLGWSADGTPSALYEWDSGNEALELGGPADAGARPDAIMPFMRAIGLGRYSNTHDDDHFLPPPVEIACLIANVRPRPEHFAGEHLGAVETW